jgi:hypothetical protein
MQTAGYAGGYSTSVPQEKEKTPNFSSYPTAAG